MPIENFTASIPAINSGSQPRMCSASTAHTTNARTFSAAASQLEGGKAWRNANAAIRTTPIDTNSGTATSSR